MWRHDPQRTARQGLPTLIADPAVKWSLPLGATIEASHFMLEDLEMDGTPDVALLRGGRVVARRLAGALMWASEPLGIGWMPWVGDFDGNGRNEVFAGSHFAGLFVFDGTSGALLWHPATTAEQRLGDVFPLDADGDGREELYVADNGCSMSGLATGRVYGFLGSSWDSAVTQVLDTSDHGYWCGQRQCAGDVDADGLPEIATLSNDSIVVYNPRTGAPVYRTAPLPPFPYGLGATFCSDVDLDGRSEILVATDNPTGYPGSPGRRLLLAEVQGAEIRVRWDLRLGDEVTSHRFPSPLAGQLVPGGPPEVVTSYFDAGDLAWHITGISGDSPDGAPLFHTTGEALLALDDLDTDGTVEMLVVGAIEPALTPFGTIRALRVDSLAPFVVTELWRVDDARLPLQPDSWGHVSRPVHSPAARAASDGLLIFRDASSDGRADEVDVLAPAAGIAHTRSTGTTVAPVAAREAPSTAAALVVVSSTDGQLGALDSELTLSNDAMSPFGIADLVETNFLPRAGTVAVVTDAGAPVVVAVDAFQSMVVWDATLAAATVAPAAIRRGADLVELPATMACFPMPSSGEHAAVSLVRTLDGGLVLSAVRPSSGAEVLRTRLSDARSEGPYWYTDVVPLRGPSSASLVVALYDPTTGSVRYPVVPVGGEAPWALDLGRSVLGGGDFSGSAWDWNGDGTEDYFVFQSAEGRTASGLTGDILQSRPAAFVGTASFVDLDGDGAVDLLHDGAATSGPRRLTTSFEPVWVPVTTRGHVQGAAGRTTAGSLRIGTALQSLAEFELYDAAVGTLLQSFVVAEGIAYPDESSARAAGRTVGAPTNVVVAGGTAGEPDSFIFGSSDGYLYAISADDGSVRWSLNLRASLGEPLVADTDGDTVSEILVPAADGNLYAVGSAALDPPAAVYDTDGTFLALGPADDLDEISRSDRVAGNWEVVPGALRYEVAVVSDDDVFVLPWTDTGTAARFIEDGLVLQLGQRYRTLVRARGGADGTHVSPETASDGFIVVDDLAPEVELSVSPDLLAVGGTSTERAAISFVAHDLVALQNVLVEVRDLGGVSMRSLESREVGGLTFTGDYSWAGDREDGSLVASGDYLLAGRATDQVGLTAEITVPVVVCRLDEDGGSSCPEADAGDGGEEDGLAPDDAVVQEDDVGVDDIPADTAGADWSGSGGGCSCQFGDAGRQETASLSAALWLFLVPLLLRRLRLRASAQQDSRVPSRPSGRSSPLG